MLRSPWYCSLLMVFAVNGWFLGGLCRHARCPICVAAVVQTAGEIGTAVIATCRSHSCQTAHLLDEKIELLSNFRACRSLAPSASERYASRRVQRRCESDGESSTEIEGDEHRSRIGTITRTQCRSHLLSAWARAGACTYARRGDLPGDSRDPHPSRQSFGTARRVLACANVQTRKPLGLNP